MSKLLRKLTIESQEKDRFMGAEINQHESVIKTLYLQKAISGEPEILPTALLLEESEEGTMDFFFFFLLPFFPLEKGSHIAQVSLKIII